MKKLIYLLCIFTVIHTNSQDKNERFLYDVNKVYIQLNDVSGEIVSSSEKLILLKNKNFFSIWSARDKRKMYDFSINGIEIKELLSPNSEYIIFFIKNLGALNNYIGKLEVKTGSYQEVKIENKDFTPLEIKSTFKFSPNNKALSVFTNNRLWNLNIHNFELNEAIEFNENLEFSYKDFLFTTESQICFKIESDIKKSYFITQLRPSKWKLDSIMLFDKKEKTLQKVKLEKSPLGAFSHRNTSVLIDYENKITALDVSNLKEKSYSKNSSQKLYKTFVERKNTLLVLGAKDLNKLKDIKSDSLYKAFEKSKEEDFDLFLYKRNESPFNLLNVNIIDDNFEYKKGKTKLPMKFYWNPSLNYFPTNFGVVYDRSNGIFSYYHKIEKPQRWHLDYTREGLTIYERLSLNDSGDFTFYGYGNKLEVINVANDDKFSNEKEGLKNRHFLNNNQVLSGYQNQEKKNIYHLELTDVKGKEIWKSEPIETKIKGDINKYQYFYKSKSDKRVFTGIT